MKKRNITVFALVLCMICSFVTCTAAQSSEFSFGSGMWESHNAIPSAENGVLTVNVSGDKGYIAKKATLKKGVEYTLSTQVKLASGSSVMQYVICCGDKIGAPDNVAVGTRVGNDWTQLTGTYTYNGESDEVDAEIYIRIGDGMEKFTYSVKDIVIDSGEKGGDNTFSDVPKDNAYYEHIRRLKNDGVISGNLNNVYAPGEKITKAEFVTMLIRGLRLVPQSYLSIFDDVAETDWYSENISLAAEKEYISKEDKLFYPESEISPKEAAKQIQKAAPAFNADLTKYSTALTRGEAAELIFKMRETINPTSVYVNGETGSDENGGTEDKPFKTIERAKAYVRENNKNMTHDIYVYLSGGRYFTDQPLEFNEADGGKGDYSVIWRGNGADMPVISGGKEITGWKLYDAEKGIYKASANGINTRHLYVNGTRATRARSEEGLKNVQMDPEIGMTYTATDEELKNFSDMKGVEFCYIVNWTLQRRVAESASVDGNKVTIKMKQPVWKNGLGNYNEAVKGDPTYYENAYFLLDKPGEFYFSQKDDAFEYIPRQGENINEIEAVAGASERLMDIHGDGVVPVKNLTFSNIGFKETTWTKTTEEGYLEVQNSYTLTARAVYANRCENVNFVGCDFSNLGAQGLYMENGIKNCNIIGNRFYDISSHAMWIGNYTSLPEAKYMEDENIDIKNNYIEKCSNEYMGSANLTAGYLKNSQIMHNEICGAPYSGMHIGWGWGAVENSNTKNLEIAYNYIHEVMTTLHDGGGIYCLGGTGGSLENPNKIYGNYFKNQYSATSCIYLDEGSSFWSVYDNVVDMVESDDAWKSQYGSTWMWQCHDNIFTNNFVSRNVYQNGGTRCYYLNTEERPDGNWGGKPGGIINNAGLEHEYKSLRDTGEFNKITTVYNPNIKIGEKIRINACAYSKNGDAIDLNHANIEYAAENPEIASIDKNGVITGVSQGKAAINVTAEIEGISKTVQTFVYVNDEFDVVEPVIKLKTSILEGEVKNGYSVTGRTKFGKPIKLDSYSFDSSDKDILTIDEKGTITAVKKGNADIVVTGKVGNIAKTIKVPIKVVSYSDPKLPQYTPLSVKDIFNDKGGWYLTDKATINKVSGNSFAVSTPGGHAYYTAKKFGSEVFKFDMSLDRNGGWPAIALRTQNETETFGTYYLVDFVNNGIEIQRFNNGARTCIFCDLDASGRIGKMYPRMVLSGKLEVGTINEETGVRIILRIDGENIINYLDEDETRIEQDGYFGIITFNETMTVTAN